MRLPRGVHPGPERPGRGWMVISMASMASGSVHGRPHTQRERVAESSRCVLRAAIELIATKGYQRTTSAEISERAGYSAPMLRARYGSKRELLDAIIRTEFEPRLFPRSDQNEAVNGLQQVLAQLARVVEVGEQDPELMHALVMLSFESASPTSELRPWMHSQLVRYTSALEEMLRRGQQDGSVDASIEPVSEAMQLVTGILGSSFLALFVAGRDDFVTWMRVWCDKAVDRLRPDFRTPQ